MTFKKKERVVTVDDPIKSIEKPADAAAAVERIRSAVTELADRDQYTAEAVERAAADLKTVTEKLEQIRQLEERVAKAEETAKIAHEVASNQRPNETRALDELKLVPMTRQWTEADRKETGFDLSDTHFNIMSMPTEELRMYVGQDSAAEKLIRQFRHVSDRLYVTHTILLGKLATDPGEQYRYLQAGGVRTLKLWPAYERAAKMLRTLDTATAGASLEWVPTMYSAQFFEDLTLPTGIADLFTWIDMPNNPYAFPMVIHGNTRDVKIVGEATASSSTGYASKDTDTPTSGKLILAVKKTGRFSGVSRELNQDSLVPVLPILAQHILLEHGYARSIMVIDSQPILSSLGTFDTGRSLTANSDVQDVNTGCTPASYGVRRSLHASGTPVDFGGTFTTDGLAAMIGQAKVAGQLGYVAFASGFTVAARSLVLKDSSGANVYLTMEKAGSIATAIRGQIGMLMGRPYVLDAMWPEDLNASGIYDGSVTTKTSIGLIRPDRFVGGRRQGITIDTSEHYYFGNDQIAVRSTERTCFAPLLTPSTTNKCGAIGVNIPSY